MGVSPSHPLVDETPRRTHHHRDTCETMAETISLKALARLVLERDAARDGQRDSLSRGGRSKAEPSRQFETFADFTSDPLSQHWPPVLPIAHGEPGLEKPCAARRGRVQELEGAFFHFCRRCGRFAAFGYGVRLRTGQLGRWYCGEHRPERITSDD